jgi:ribosomal protein S18 acetylase RimI-like enzyme
MIQIKAPTYFGKPAVLEFKDTKQKDNHNVGYVLFSTIGDVECYLWFIYVPDAHRKKGYGKMMLKHLMGEKPDFAINDNEFKGFATIKTEWSASTPKGRDLLMSMGFKKEKTWLAWHKSET